MVIALNGGQPPLASEPAGTATAWPDDDYQKMEDLVLSWLLLPSSGGDLAEFFFESRFAFTAKL